MLIIKNTDKISDIANELCNIPAYQVSFEHLLSLEIVLNFKRQSKKRNNHNSENGICDWHIKDIKTK